MSRNQRSWGNKISLVCSLVIVLFVLFQLYSVIVPRLTSYTSPYYTESVYKNLENVFNRSQYRVKNSPALIPDETVFSYAAGAYLHGIDPILINSEITPLGKYFIGLFILLFRNDKLAIIPFAALVLLTLWLLARKVFPNSALALIPVAILSSEKLFLNQLVVTPLLDIVQLPFIFLSIYFFIKESRHEKYWLTAISLGLVSATKSVIMSALLISAFVMYFFISRRLKAVGKFCLFIPLSGMVLVLSYMKTFMDGYTFAQFIGFQKWIILYQKSKILFPFSVWRLIFLNQWQAWWGNMGILKADDWSATWPVFTGLTFLLIIFILIKKIKARPEIQLLICWFVIYGSFLSIGVVSSRFLLPLLPVAFILGIYLLKIICLNKMTKL